MVKPLQAGQASEVINHLVKESKFMQKTDYSSQEIAETT